MSLYSKHLKRLTLSTIFLISLNVPCSFALEPSDEPITTTQTKSESNLTISDIEKIFQKYLDDNNIDIKLGTSEYLNYVYTQMLDVENRDENLRKHPQYDLICDYFA